MNEIVGLSVTVFVVGVGVGDGGEQLGERLVDEVAECVRPGVWVDALV